MTFRDSIYQYLYCKGEQLDNYYDSLKENIRILRIDEVDYMELIIAKVRCDLFRELSGDIMRLTKGSGKK